MTHPRPYIAILVFLLCTLACASQPLPVPTTTPTVQPAENPQVVTVTGNVYIRYEGEITGLVAYTGMRLVGYPDGDVFRLLSGETVWIGCVDIETEKECRSK